MSNSHARDLPASPDLEQQRKRAKELLKSLRNGDADAARRLRYNHPRLARVPPDAIRAGVVKLADAQWVIAREYGFASWRRLKEHIDAVNAGATEPARAFEIDLQYYRDRAAGMRSVHATGERNALRLIRRFHPAFAGSSEQTIRSAEITLDDAELILAREHGFADWDDFAKHVEALRSGDVVEPFRVAFEAIRTDDRRGLRAILATHPSLVSAKGTNGNTLLNLAVGMGRLSLADDLLAAGADADLPNNKGWTALHQAAYGGSMPMLERLLGGEASVDVEAYGDGGTPLAVALFRGHRPAADRLAQAAIVPHNLRVAAALGRLDLMQGFFATDGSLLPEAGDHREFHRPHSGFPAWRPTNERAEIIDEALGWAARSGRIEAMAFLLEHGANIDAEPYNGTALHWAVRQDQTEAAAWLLDHGADINRRASFGGVRGITPLHAAVAWDGKPGCARLLMERGADATILDEVHKSTPIGWAKHFGNTGIHDDLLDLGSQRDIFVAVLGSRLDRIAALLDEQPERLNARNAEGATPLAIAREAADDAVISFLRARGALAE